MKSSKNEEEKRKENVGERKTMLILFPAKKKKEKGR